MFLEILKDDTYQTLIDEINNCGYSINELINILSRLSNNTLNIQYLPKRSVDINKNILDVTHAYKELGWKAKIDIETGIKKILDGD